MTGLRPNLRLQSQPCPTSHNGEGEGVIFTLFPFPRAARAVSSSSGKGVMTSSLTSRSSVQTGLIRPNLRVRVLGMQRVVSERNKSLRACSL